MTEAKLTRAAIIDAGIELADLDGLDALSMRRIAERMGVGAMSLYRHIANKDELIGAMAEEVARRYPYPPADEHDWTWRDRVLIAARLDWELYQQHPWVLLAFAVPRYSFGPSSLDCLAWLVEGFRELQVSTREATRMSFAVWNYISGAILPHISPALVTRQGPDTPRGNGLWALLDGQPCYPTPAALAELHGTHQEFEQADLLESGLEALCDGLAQRAKQQRPDSNGAETFGGADTP